MRAGDARNGCSGTPQASSITRYAWDELSAYGDVVAELNSTNTTATMQYVVGDGTVLAQQAGTSVAPRFLLHDGQGNTRSLVDNGGANPENYTYDAFGTLTSPTTTPQTRYLYAGQQFDKATGLYNLRARYYNAGQGRFLSRDVADYNFQDPTELNRYGYTANNPINGVDPSGYETIGEGAQINLSNSVTDEGSLSAEGTTTAEDIAAEEAEELSQLGKEWLNDTVKEARRSGEIPHGKGVAPFVVVLGMYLNKARTFQLALTVNVVFNDPTGEIQRVLQVILGKARSLGWFVGGGYEFGTGEHAESVFLDLMDGLSRVKDLPMGSLVPAGVSKSFCTPANANYGGCDKLGDEFGIANIRIIPRLPRYTVIMFAPPAKQT